MAIIFVLYCVVLLVCLGVDNRREREPQLGLEQDGVFAD